MNELMIKWQNGDSAIYRFTTRGDAVTGKMILENHCGDEIEDIKIESLEQQPCEDAEEYELNEQMESSSEKPNKSEILTDWIPVSKRLPEPQKDGNKDFSEWVLVTLHIRKNDDVVGRAYYCFSDKTWYAERFGSGKVVAWMPQPEPYKESEE